MVRRSGVLLHQQLSGCRQYDHSFVARCNKIQQNKRRCKYGWFTKCNMLRNMPAVYFYSYIVQETERRYFVYDALTSGIIISKTEYTCNIINVSTFHLSGVPMVTKLTVKQGKCLTTIKQM